MGIKHIGHIGIELQGTSLRRGRWILQIKNVGIVTVRDLGRQMENRKNWWKYNNNITRKVKGKDGNDR